MQELFTPENVRQLLEDPVFVMFALIVTVVDFLLKVLYIVTFARLFHRTGRHWALGFLALIPLASLVILVYLAFGRWPVLEELAALKTAEAPRPHPVREQPLS